MPIFTSCEMSLEEKNGLFNYYDENIDLKKIHC